MSGEWPGPSHVCAGSGEPALDAWTHGCIRLYPGATVDEITEKVLGIAGWKDAYDRRTAGDRVREIMARPAKAGGRIADITEVREAESRLGPTAGERKIAKEVGVSRATVRRVKEDAGER